MTELDKLIEAVEAGEVSDWAFGSGYPRTVLGDRWETGMNAYCGSLDAALALHEALLPGCGASIQTFGFVRIYRDHGGDDRISESDYISHGGVSSKGQSLKGGPARAWLHAILRAYRSIQA